MRRTAGARAARRPRDRLELAPARARRADVEHLSSGRSPSASCPPCFRAGGCGSRPSRSRRSSGSTMRSGPPRPGEAWNRIVDGFYLYYDVPLPFRAEGHPLMHGIVVLAVLGFTLAISLAVAERRALLATGLLVAGAAWPATLLTSSNTVGRGAVILVRRARPPRRALERGTPSAGLRSPRPSSSSRRSWSRACRRSRRARFSAGRRGSRRARASCRSASATSGTRTTPRSTWPERKTTVLTIEAPPISRYWRATTLDVFNGDYWLESTLEVQPDPLFDPLMPPRRPQREAAARSARQGRGAPGQPADRRQRPGAVRARRRGRVRALPVDRHRVRPARRSARLDLHVVELRAAAGGARPRALRADLLLPARPLPRRAVAYLDAALAALRLAGAAPGDGPDLRRRTRRCARIGRSTSARSRSLGTRRARTRPSSSSRRRSATARATCTTRTRRRAGTCRRSSSS